MGCGDSRMKLEDEMIKLKFERSRIQMERKKQIQLLEGIEHRKIAESIIPDYICLEPEKPEIKIKTEVESISVLFSNRNLIISFLQGFQHDEPCIILQVPLRLFSLFRLRLCCPFRRIFRFLQRMFRRRF